MLVLDPFLSAGQTVKVARWMGRQYAGYEVIENCLELTRQRLEQPLNMRAGQLVGNFGKMGLREQG